MSEAGVTKGLAAFLAILAGCGGEPPIVGSWGVCHGAKQCLGPVYQRAMEYDAEGRFRLFEPPMPNFFDVREHCVKETDRGSYDWNGDTMDVQIDGEEMQTLTADVIEPWVTLELVEGGSPFISHRLETLMIVGSSCVLP